VTLAEMLLFTVENMAGESDQPTALPGKAGKVPTA
jgi:hypothetical protein